MNDEETTSSHFEVFFRGTFAHKLTIFDYSALSNSSIPVPVFSSPAFSAIQHRPIGAAFFSVARYQG